ncbi:hypothetical protein CORC01_14006, partial [Colletotrichum orchidophilum]
FQEAYTERRAVNGVIFGIVNGNLKKKTCVCCVSSAHLQMAASMRTTLVYACLSEQKNQGHAYVICLPIPSPPGHLEAIGQIGHTLIHGMVW